jgi:error-prone DNA polymerase
MINGRWLRSMIDRYVELHAASSFSFLEGASQPEKLVERAVELEMPSMALLDRNGVYGSARFHTSAKRNDIHAHAERRVSSLSPQLTRRQGDEGPLAVALMNGGEAAAEKA